MISDAYLEELKQLHKERQDFGANAHRWTPDILELCQEYQTYDVLDYGCGKGMLARSMPFDIREYDPAIKGKNRRPAPADLVVCTDVLEHIEPEMIVSVLAHLSALTKKVGFFVIATRKAVKTLPSGRNAHLIVETGTWWYSMLCKDFSVDGWSWDGYEMVAKVNPQ